MDTNSILKKKPNHCHDNPSFGNIGGHLATFGEQPKIDFGVGGGKSCQGFYTNQNFADELLKEIQKEH